MTDAVSSETTAPAASSAPVNRLNLPSKLASGFGSVGYGVAGVALTPRRRHKIAHSLGIHHHRHYYYRHHHHAK